MTYSVLLTTETIFFVDLAILNHSTQRENKDQGTNISFSSRINNKLLYSTQTNVSFKKIMSKFFMELNFSTWNLMLILFGNRSSLNILCRTLFSITDV